MNLVTGALKTSCYEILRSLFVNAKMCSLNKTIFKVKLYLVKPYMDLFIYILQNVLRYFTLFSTKTLELLDESFAFVYD